MNGPTPSELEIQIQQRMLEELAAAERRYRNLVEQLQDVVIECDGDGRIRYLNHAWEQALGYPVQDCLGHPLADYLYDREEALHANEDGAPQEDHREVRLRHRDGHPVWFELSLSRHKDTVVGLLYNVERRKETERTLERARDAAIEAARLRTEFLANMSHEIRTPLHGIMGMLDLIGQGPLPPQLQGYLETAQESARHLLTLLNDILDLSRIEAGGLKVEWQPLDLHRLLEDAVALMRPKAEEKGLDLRLRRPPDLPRWIEGDAARLRQVLFNLLSNAVKFTERGHVTLRARRRGDTLEIAVADSGIGIPRERQRAVFEAFTQADGSITRRYGDTGLGLAISRRLAEAMDGGIRLRSRPGRGSIFTLHLPLRPAAPPRQASPATPPPTQTPIEAHVLVVEDNPVNRKLARAMLERLGCRVTLAENGSEGVALAHQQPYDLIIMDCQMPVLDGFEAARRIRAQGGPSAQAPILAVTANAMPEDRERCLRWMDDYLPKPLDLATLAERLRHWLAQSAET